MHKSISISAGTTALALRLVIGWTYFSAFWRRLILENKLDPEALGYIGEKFNHFLPHALFIKAPIEYLLLNPEILWWVMLIFTIVEGVTGLFYMFGLYTRTMSLIVMQLALGILLSAGWIGTTCLDEWQIGILGLAGGLTIFFTGGGTYSLDQKFNIDEFNFKPFKWFYNQKTVLVSSLFIFFIALATNQHFHGGLWGTLHNKSVSPELKLTDLITHDQKLSFQVMRTHGADVYGSFVYKIDIINLDNREVIYSLTGDEINQNKLKIENRYVAKVKHGAHALVVPLGASAKITLSPPGNPISSYVIKLTDISGKSWSISTVDQNISQDQAMIKSIEESGIVIDVRSKEEFNEGHLPNAINIPVETVKDSLQRIKEIAARDPQKPLYLYCKSGQRAQIAMQTLKEYNVKALNIGGYEQLKQQ